MKERTRYVHSLFVALTALALSAGLAFGATPPPASWGLSNAASNAGKTVPVAGGAEDPLAGEDEGGEEGEAEDAGDVEDPEDTAEDLASEESEEAGENCTTDPTLLAEADLAALNHGSIVCWAAHQTEWPAWFSNHGAWVRCWAHHGKDDAASCTEDPAAEETTVEQPAAEATVAGPGKGQAKGHGKGKAGGKSKHRD